MNEITIKIPDDDHSRECIICMEDLSDNLIENKYCDCNFNYHENCYEKWLVYTNLSPINIERDNSYVDYRCILCRKSILFDVKINEWLDENNYKFKELEHMRDMTHVVIRNVILNQRTRIRRARTLARRIRCCVCERYSRPFLINITCCYNVTIWNKTDVRVIMLIFIFLLGMFMLGFMMIYGSNPGIF
jgi:hypothetical protein